MSLKYTYRFPFNDSLAPLSESIDSTNDLTEELGTASTFTDSTYGDALYLDGTTSLVSPNVYTTITSNVDRTISFWATVESFEAPILSYGTLVSPDAFVLYAGDSSGLVAFSDFSSDIVSTITTPINVWRFYTFVYSSGALNVYIDGVLEDTLVTGALTTGTGDFLRVGTDGAGSYLTGLLLDMRVYDHTLDLETIEYMNSKGPNYEEPAGFDYIETMPTLGTGVHGTVVCRDIYAIKETGGEAVSSLFGTDSSSNIVESARFTHSDESIKASVRTTNSSGVSYMTSVIESDPEKTSFFTTGSDDSRKSVVFSSEGVKITSESPYGMYFGEDKDFRMVFEEGDGSTTVDSWKIQALDGSSGSYITKFEIESS